MFCKALEKAFTKIFNSSIRINSYRVKYGLTIQNNEKNHKIIYSEYKKFVKRKVFKKNFI